MAEGKWIDGLDPGMPVADAARLVLAARFETVRHFLPLAAEKPYEDSEHVHQLRVGTRRARAALKVFGDWLPRKRLKAAKKSLRLIRRAAGDARDWDVFLQRMGGRTDAGPAIDFLIGYALGERNAAQARLVEAAADGYSDLDALVDRVPSPRKADDMFGELALDQLGDLFDSFTDAVEANPTEPGALHQLRIHAKHVRYAIEIFAPCFAAPLRDALYPAVEALQEHLGELQDASVGITRLGTLQERVRQVIPGEWPRLEAGLGELLNEFRQQISDGEARFQVWRAEWAKLTAACPLDELLLTTSPD